SAVMVLSFPGVAAAHYERPTTAPDGTGHVPAYRTGGQHLLVCKSDPTDFEKRIAGFAQDLQDYNRGLYAECIQNGYRDLQAAVDHVTGDGTTILVLPGLYLAEPSLLPEPDACNHLPAKRVPAGYQILSYEQQKMCPHQQNLVGIFGIKDLQIEGTGATQADVVFDAQFQKLNVIRGDRTNGLYLRNFTTQRSTFNAIYVIETDGFVINHVVGRWNTEYGFLSFAADHGLITNCEAYGNGDSGIYPGGTSDINRNRGFDVPRYAIEVTASHSHDNRLGYWGTGGDSAWAHDNEFDHNTSRPSMDGPRGDIELQPLPGQPHGYRHRRPQRAQRSRLLLGWSGDGQLLAVRPPVGRRSADHATVPWRGFDALARGSQQAGHVRHLLHLRPGDQDLSGRLRLV